MAPRRLGGTNGAESASSSGGCSSRGPSLERRTSAGSAANGELFLQRRDEVEQPTSVVFGGGRRPHRTITTRRQSTARQFA
jgi:hypothetical protein